MKTFYDWLQDNHIELKDWQKDIAIGVLSKMKPHREGATGKTFLMKHLSQFINEHGNDYAIGFPENASPEDNRTV